MEKLRYKGGLGENVMKNRVVFPFEGRLTWEKENFTV